MCLFVSGQKTRTLKVYLRMMMQQRRYSTVWFQDFAPVVAMLWPRQKVEEFLEWAKDAKLPGMPNPRSDDAVVGSWMKFTRQTILATVPSLVEHPDDVVSVKKDGFIDTWGKDRGRKACWFIGDEDPLQYDWSSDMS